jgi:hypothetical protein
MERKTRIDRKKLVFTDFLGGSEIQINNLTVNNIPWSLPSDHFKFLSNSHLLNTQLTNLTVVYPVKMEHGLNS